MQTIWPTVATVAAYLVKVVRRATLVVLGTLCLIGPGVCLGVWLLLGLTVVAFVWVGAFILGIMPTTLENACEQAASSIWAWLSETPPFGYLLGADLDSDLRDAQNGGAAYGDKDGYSVFNALATFALAQAAALTAVAKGDEHKLLVLSIYAVAVIITLFWTVRMIRAVRQRVATEADRRPYTRAYDEPTIVYARWVFGWILILAVVLVYLGWNNLLPNQTNRVQITTIRIDAEVLDQNDLQQQTGPRRNLDEWLDGLSTSAIQAEREAMFLVRQRVEFPDSYTPFVVKFSVTSRFMIGRRFAFLVTPNTATYRSQYRQLSFRSPDMRDVSSDILDIEDANRGEYILIIAFVRGNLNEPFPSKEAMSASLSVVSSKASK